MKWSITRVDCNAQMAGQENVVTMAHWECVHEENDGSTPYTARIYGTAGFAYEPNQPFTSFDQLTKEQVMGWVWSQVDRDGIEAQIMQQIETLKKPQIVSYVKPDWSI